MPDTNITKSALARSMKKLMEERDFSKISVTDICEGCGMNRKSFYYHFKDKYDLMNWIFYTEFITMVSKSSFKDGWDLMLAVARLFYNDQRFYRRALKTDGQNSFREYFHESTAPVINYMFQDYLEEDEEQTIIEDMFSEAFLSAIIRWLEQGCTLTPEEFVKRIEHLIMAIARPLDKNKKN